MKFCLIFLICINAICYGQKSPFNNRLLKDTTTQEFSFIVAGHLHGASNNISGFPASTVLGGIEDMNAQESAFMLSLGDLFLSPPRDLKNYPKVLFNKLNMPIFNAVGNHDIEDIDYENNFGKTFFTFKYANISVVVLDTEKDNGDIEGEQLTLLKEVLQSNVEHVFIAAHRPIWAEYHEELRNVFKGNTSAGTNYGEDVYPLLKSSKSKIFMFGGSLGGEAPVSFFFHKPTDNITYIATAVRNLPRDGFLKVSVNSSQVSITPISLTGQTLKNIEHYNLAFWGSNSADKSFNWRLLPLYVYQALSGWHFWFGVLCASGGVFIVLWLLKRRKRKQITQL